MKPFICLGAAALALAMAAGCGKPSAASVAASHAVLFPDGQLKADSDKVITALRTNGFVPAETTLVDMEREKPNAAQLQAIHETMTRLKSQILEAVASGDINASNQLKALIRTNQILY